MKLLDIDYETASKADIKKVGLDVYSRDPSTKVLMMAYRYDAGDGLEPGPPKLWYPHQGPMPAKLRAAMTDPTIRKVAHNAAFELAISRNVLGLDVTPQQWYCTMVMALSLGLPGKLEYLVRDALKLERKYWKDSEGDRLMRIFSFPSSKATHETHPAEFAAYGEYCRQDVVAEAKVFSVLRRYVSNMGQLFDGWCLDQRINARGLPVDIDFIESAQALAARSKQEYKDDLIARTGLQNPNSTKQMLGWLQQRGYPFASLAKNRVKIALKDFAHEIHEEAAEVLRIRLESNKTSLAKYDALKRASWRGRLRGTFQYYGAAATGRYAGRILGQNMPRPDSNVEDFLAEARDMIARRQLDDIKFFFGKPLEVLSSSIRSAIAAPKGKKLVVADLSSIELCVIAWWTRCGFWLDVVESGKDAYKAFAEHWLGVPYDEVTKPQRSLSKPPALGCFAGETEILTKRGWVQIIDVRADDQVFDGVEFVSHDGVADQGVKPVIYMHGVWVTPDHLILCGDDSWQESESVAREATNTRRATELAIGMCSRLSDMSWAEKRPGTTDASATTAGRNMSCTEAISREGRLHAALPAPAASPMTLGGRSTGGSASSGSTSSVCPTAFTQCGQGVSGALGRSTSTPAEALSAGSSTPRTSSDMQLPSMAGTTPASTQTGKTTTDITSRGTSDSSPTKSTNETSERTSSSSTPESGLSSKTSILGSAPRTGTALRCEENSQPVHLHEKSSSNKIVAEVPTFDIVNAGPRSRFVIRTDAGPMLAHNCGYRMGAGREVGVFPDTEKTGLWGYAANMGVAMSKAECKAAVKIYRDLSPEIVQAWHDVENAAMECVLTGEPRRAGMLSFDLKSPFLRMRLPSGRYVHYCRPRVEEVEIEYEVEDEETGEIEVVISRKIGLTYERLSQGSGKWVRRSQHGGRFAEQATQAIALDVLQAGIVNCEKAALPVVFHYHDELGVLVDEDDDTALDRLIDCMTRSAAWAAGLTLRAEGYESGFYKKG